MINLRETCVFPLETQGLYSTARVHNFFRPGRNGNSVGSEVTHRPMAAEINRCRLNRLFRRRSKKTSKLHATDLYEGRGIHRWLVDSAHKGPITKKNFHLMTSSCFRTSLLCILLHACRFTWLFSTAVRADFYLWSGNILANERRGWICNVYQ